MGEFFVYSAFFGTLLFFFPVFLWLDAFVDAGRNRAWFSVSLFRHLQLFGGYGQLDGEGIALHLSRKTAIFVPYNKMGEARKKFEVTKGFQLWRFHQVVETGGAGSVYSVLIAAAIRSLCGGAGAFWKTKHPFLSFKNATLLCDEPCFKLTVQTAVVFNGFVLALAFSKKMLEALINWIRKRRSTAFSKRQLSS